MGKEKETGKLSLDVFSGFPEIVSPQLSSIYLSLKLEKSNKILKTRLDNNVLISYDNPINK
jgi:hypothetical protein